MGTKDTEVGVQKRRSTARIHRYIRVNSPSGGVPRRGEGRGDTLTGGSVLDERFKSWPGHPQASPAAWRKRFEDGTLGSTLVDLRSQARIPGNGFERYHRGAGTQTEGFPGKGRRGIENDTRLWLMGKDSSKQIFRFQAPACSSGSQLSVCFKGGINQL